MTRKSSYNSFWAWCLPWQLVTITIFINMIFKLKFLSLDTKRKNNTHTFRLFIFPQRNLDIYLQRWKIWIANLWSFSSLSRPSTHVSLALEKNTHSKHKTCTRLFQYQLWIYGIVSVCLLLFISFLVFHFNSTKSVTSTDGTSILRLDWQIIWFVIWYKAGVDSSEKMLKQNYYLWFWYILTSWII